MGRVVCDVAVSADGFVAGPEQSLEHPIGIRGHDVHRWMMETPEENAAEIARITQARAFIMGRNMFGPVRGRWEDSDVWDGWWGDTPPYGAPVFVLTNHAREPLELLGGTTFHFVTEGVQTAFDRARDAAGDGDIAIAGGASTINQFLAAGLLDELRLHIAPVLLGSGERIFDGAGDAALRPISSRTASLVTHLTYEVERGA